MCLRSANSKQLKEPSHQNQTAEQQKHSFVALFLVSSNKLAANMDSAVAMVKDKLAGLRSKLDQIPILQQAEVS